MRCIILTKRQADQVRGTTRLGHALNPLPLKDGSFVLPERVLNDPAHQVAHSKIDKLTIREVNETEFARPTVRRPATNG